MKKLAVIAGLVVWMISGDWLLGLSTFVLALGWVFLPAEEGPPVLALAYTLQWVTVCVGLYYVAITGRPLQATLGSDYQPMSDCVSWAIRWVASPAWTAPRWRSPAIERPGASAWARW